MSARSAVRVALPVHGPNVHRNWSEVVAAIRMRVAEHLRVDVELDAADVLKCEVLAASHSEREALVGGGEHLAAATAFTVAAIIMREVAAALEDELEAA